MSVASSVTVSVAVRTRTRKPVLQFEKKNFNNFNIVQKLRTLLFDRALEIPVKWNHSTLFISNDKDYALPTISFFFLFSKRICSEISPPDKFSIDSILLKL